MKRVLFLILLALALPTAAWSQIITEFNIDFGANPPPHTPTVPNSGAILKQYSNDNLFSLVVYLNNTPPTSASLLQKQGDGSFTSISDLSVVYAAYGGSYSGVAYSAERAWQLTGDQIQNLLAGSWYAQINYADTTYLGRITPVPEPSVILLLACGASLIGMCHRKRERGIRIV